MEPANPDRAAIPQAELMLAPLHETEEQRTRRLEREQNLRAASLAATAALAALKGAIMALPTGSS